MSLPSSERPTVDVGGQRGPIGQSWQRVQRSGLSADVTLGQAPTTDVDATSSV